MLISQVFGSLLGLWLSLSSCLAQSDQELDGLLLKFSSRIFDAIAPKEHNMVLSPIAMHSSLSILAMGLKKDSSELDKLSKVLGYETSNSNNLKPRHREYRDLMQRLKDVSSDHETSDHQNHKLRLSFDHDILVGADSSLKGKFNNWVNNYYHAQARVLAKDDESEKEDLAAKINGKARKYGFTHDLVKPNKLIQSDSGVTILTTMFISAGWSEIKFERDHEAIFYEHGKAKCSVYKALRSDPTDKIKVIAFSNDKMDYCAHAKMAQPPEGMPDFRVIELTLDGGMTFTMLEPNDESSKALAKLESAIFDSKTSNLVKILDKIDSIEPIDVDYVVMPAFKMEDKLNVRDILVDKFNLGSLTSGGPITQLLDGGHLNLERSEHNAVLKISHKGAKGAGSSALGDRGYKCKIKMERPYVFIIRQAKTPIYVGHLVSIKDA